MKRALVLVALITSIASPSLTADTSAPTGQQTQQASAEEIVNFKKAFSVCLEAKDYLVKY